MSQVPYCNLWAYAKLTGGGHSVRVPASGGTMPMRARVIYAPPQAGKAATLQYATPDELHTPTTGYWQHRIHDLDIYSAIDDIPHRNHRQHRIHNLDVYSAIDDIPHRNHLGYDLEATNITNWYESEVTNTTNWTDDATNNQHLTTNRPHWYLRQQQLYFSV